MLITLIVILKVSAVIFVIIAGVFFINVDNWTPFIPDVQTIIVDNKPHQAYGIGGVISGAAAIFFAYVGFDAVSTQAGEAINPKKGCTFCNHCFAISLYITIYIGFFSINWYD